MIVLSAGNLRGDIEADSYLDRNDLEEIESPAQAWNALVAGAYTDKITIANPDYAGWAPLAPAGDLCPSSRTSGVWDRQWPIRPSVKYGDPILTVRSSHPVGKWAKSAGSPPCA